MDPRTTRISGAFVFAVLAAALVAVGSFGPWATLGIFHANGLDGSNDGWITLVSAALSGVVLWRAYLRLRPTHGLQLGVLALVAIAVGIYDANDISSRHATFLGQTISPDVGWGLSVVIGAGVALLGAAIQLWRNARRDMTNTSPGTPGPGPISDPEPRR